jgi:hypothetical protein
MIVSYRGDVLRFAALNNLDYVFKNIPFDLSHRQSNLPGSTKVEVAIEVDGIFTRHIPFKRETPTAKADIEEVRSKLKISGDELGLNSVSVTQAFHVRVMIKLTYTLENCTGTQIVEDLQTRIETLKKNGLKVQEPPTE